MEKEILLKRFNSNLLAEAAQNLLKSYGITSYLKIEGGIEFRGALGDSYGAKLYVLEKDYKRAREIIENKAKEVAGLINPFSFEKFEKRLYRKAGEGSNVFHHY